MIKRTALLFYLERQSGGELRVAKESEEALGYARSPWGAPEVPKLPAAQANAITPGLLSGLRLLPLHSNQLLQRHLRLLLIQHLSWFLRLRSSSSSSNSLQLGRLLVVSSTAQSPKRTNTLITLRARCL